MSTTQSNKGLIVSYIDKGGKLQFALALYIDQKPQFANFGKVFLRLLDEEFNPMKSGEGKNLIAVKHKKELTQVGFQD